MIDVYSSANPSAWIAGQVVEIEQKERVAEQKEKVEVGREREERSPVEGFAIQIWKKEKHQLVKSLEN